jgi:hypothetical protein
VTALDDYIRRRDAMTGGATAAPDPGPEPSAESESTSAAGSNPYLRGAHVRATAAPAAEEEEESSTPHTTSPALRAWRTLTSPLRAVTGVSGNVGGRLGQLISPSAYDAAAKEKAAGILDGEDRELTPLEQAEALPGLGDVAAQGISREGVTGRLVRPVAELGLNILGDPSTYVGGLGALTKVGRASRALAVAQEGLKAAEVAGDVARATEVSAQIPTLAGRVAELAGTESGVGRGARRILESVDTLNHGGAAARELMTRPSFGAAAKFGATLPFGPVAGVVYAPEIIEGVGAGVRRRTRMRAPGS